MDNIEKIEVFIDKILNQPKWSEKEINFWSLLQKKVIQYSDRIPDYELEQDRLEIIQNIQEQPWFQESKYQIMHLDLLKDLEIEEYETRLEDGLIQNLLQVKFPQHKFWLKLDFYLSWDTQQAQPIPQDLRYYLYLEDFDQLKRAYLAHYNTVEDNRHPLDLNSKLPQLSEFFSIIKLGSPVSKIELLKLFSEIILYFDESENISKTHIGKQYPVTLTYFLEKI